MLINVLIGLATFSALLWLGLLFHPYKPYLYREILTEDPSIDTSNFPLVSVVIPARNEEKTLPVTLPSILSQKYPNLEIILVDDHSTDSTADTATNIATKFQLGGFKIDHFKIIDGKPLPDGWAGKMWALSQGIENAHGEYLLLTDADISYPPYMLATLVHQAQESQSSMVSIMAHLQTKYFWERLLIPAFLYFFKVLYPFAAVNNPNSKVAAAAGGCILVKNSALKKIGGILAISSELIDDVALAKKVKKNQEPILLYNGPKVLSIRSYQTLKSIWAMVSRSAFTELGYSYIKLFGCFLAMIITFCIPLIGICYSLYFLPQDFLAYSPIAAYVFLSLSYFPTISYFKLPFYFTLSLPFVGILYLLMTLDSALCYTLGIKARWKGRVYK